MMYLCHLRLFFILANSAYPDEMPHNAAFHLGLHCFRSTCLPVSRMNRVKKGVKKVYFKNSNQPVHEISVLKAPPSSQAKD